MDKIFHTQSATVAGPLRENLALVETAIDHHAQVDETIRQQIADAVRAKHLRFRVYIVKVSRPDSDMNAATCSIPNCNHHAHARGFCRGHYDQWRCRLRTERAKQKRHSQPFRGFRNAYRPGSGYWIIFELIRTNLPMTTDEIVRRARIELVKIGKTNYRLDYAWEVIKAKHHSSKKGDYQLWQDPHGHWHLIRDRNAKPMTVQRFHAA